jgi:GxxExxY protein
MNENVYNQITSSILKAAVEVHRNLGPGLVESVYEGCLFFELAESGLTVERQKRLPVIYKGIDLEKDFFIDLLVENSIVVELKSVETLQPVHEAQLLTYLKLSECKLGLLINFNVPVLKEGIRRKINGNLNR